MASEVHYHVHLAFADHKPAGPMAAGLYYQRQVHVNDHLDLLGEAPNGGWTACCRCGGMYPAPVCS